MCMGWKKAAGKHCSREDKHYENDVREEGYPSVKKYGICFYKKECLVMAGE